MSEKNLMICDKEFLFAEGLAENVSVRNEFAVKVYACTNIDRVLRFQNRKKIHILIIDERFPAVYRKEIEAEQVFVLTKDRCRDLQENEKEIFKYQSADKILAEVFETYCENTKDNILKSFRKGKHRLIAVYSPLHRIGKTAFALSLGKELARNEKVLYLNFEEYADIGGRFVRTEGRNLGDLLYYMRQEKGNFSLRLTSMIEKIEELDSISPINNSADLKEVTGEEWIEFIGKIQKESMYETIVLDLSESMQGLFEVLRMCDRIYMPVLGDEISERKLRCFEENLAHLQFSDIMEKTYQFTAADDMEEYGIALAKEEW